eukprot:TRINITY_DN25459_c0_g1_i2.p1 TRINITY_DN25459_c0_g1~~TRINITY_DN25459_c0_g1_i2.p1  ORF type:complete len:501 (+),score=111.94 TRINITY_DN25459_c0_g1_i2:44-1546(+)
MGKKRGRRSPSYAAVKRDEDKKKSRSRSSSGNSRSSNRRARRRSRKQTKSRSRSRRRRTSSTRQRHRSRRRSRSQSRKRSRSRRDRRRSNSRSRGRNRRNDNGVKLFVGRLPREATQQTLRDCFEEIGEVKEVFLIEPKGVNAATKLGCAFVRMVKVECGERAIATFNDQRILMPDKSKVPLQVAFAKGEAARLGLNEKNETLPSLKDSQKKIAELEEKRKYFEVMQKQQEQLKKQHKLFKMSVTARFMPTDDLVELVQDGLRKGGTFFKEKWRSFCGSSWAPKPPSKDPEDHSHDGLAHFVSIVASEFGHDKWFKRKFDDIRLPKGTVLPPMPMPPGPFGPPPPFGHHHPPPFGPLHPPPFGPPGMPPPPHFGAPPFGHHHPGMQPPPVPVHRPKFVGPDLSHMDGFEDLESYSDSDSEDAEEEDSSDDEEVDEPAAAASRSKAKAKESKEASEKPKDKDKEAQPQSAAAIAKELKRKLQEYEEAEGCASDSSLGGKDI